MNTIKTNFQVVNFEKHSAIVQCHVDKKRMWILDKEGNFDYYSQIGLEPPLRICVDKNITPRRIWSNKRSSRFILETIDFSLYYFQTSDLISDLFYNSKTKTSPTPQTIGMKKFFRIGALKNGPVSSIFFDDDPQDPYATRQIFIIVKGGGVLILSIETILDEDGKEQRTIISDFYTFPTLFINFNILDMKIFRFIEHKPSLTILEEIKKQADSVLTHYSEKNKEYQIPTKTFDKISELEIIFNTTNDKIKKIYKLYETFKKLYDKLNETIINTIEEQEIREDTLNRNQQQNAFLKKFAKGDTENEVITDALYFQGNLSFEATPEKTRMIDELEKFLKYEENNKKDIDSAFYMKMYENPNLIHPSFQDWLDCIENMNLIKDRSNNAVSKIYQVAFLFQQFRQLVTRGRIKKLKDDTNNENEADNDNDNENKFDSSRKEDHKNNEEEDNDDDDDDEDSNNSKFNIEEFEFVLDFDAEFGDSDKKNKDRKKKDKRDKNSPKIPYSLLTLMSSFESELKKQISELKFFLKGEKMKNFERIIDLRQEIDLRKKKISEINKNLDSLKERIDNLFESQNIQPVKYNEDYEISKSENFPENNDIEFLTPGGIDKLNNEVQSILNELKESAKKSIDLYQSIESFCGFMKPFYEDVKMTNVENDPFNIIRNYVVILAEDRIIFGYTDENDLINIFEAMLDKKIPNVKVYEEKMNDISNANLSFSKIDIHSKLVHKPLKTMPSYKRPTFYIACWDSDKNTNVCYSFKFKRVNQRKKKSNSNLLFIETNEYKEIRHFLNDEDESIIFRQIKTFEFEPNMKLVYYKITPSGLLVVQNGQRADSKVVCYEISSLLSNASSTRGQILWYKEITDYSLLPILGCDYSLEAGLILYNSMNIRLIERENVDSESFNSLIEYKNPKLIMKVRKYLALTSQQKEETFFILLTYAMNQLYKYENALYIQIKSKEVKYGEIDSKTLFEKVNEAKNALMKHINTAPCSKMSIFLFLMNDKKLNKTIKYYISNDNENDDNLFERFRRFRIEFLINLLESVNIKNRHQQEVLFLIAFDLLIQCFSTQNNKSIYNYESSNKNGDSKKKLKISKKSNNNNDENSEDLDIYAQNLFQVDDYQSKSSKELEETVNSYFQKSYTDEIDISVINSLTNRYGLSLSSPLIAYYIIKCFPILDSASFFQSENEWYIENAYSKIYKFLVKGSNDRKKFDENKQTFTNATKLLQNLLSNYQNDYKRVKSRMSKNYEIEKRERNVKEIDKAINCLFLFGIENFNNRNWFKQNFSNFFKFIEKMNHIPEIPQTILSLFIFIRQSQKDKKSDNFSQFDPVVHFMNEYYAKNLSKKIDLLFSINVSMGFKEIELLRKCDRYDVTLAIYRLSRFRVQAAKLLERLQMTSVSIDIVLDESATTAIKFASSLKDENTMLYLVRTASRKNEGFDLIYDNVIGSKRNISSSQLYDIFVCIPDNKMKACLNENISNTFEEIDEKSNEELKKINSLQDKMKSKALLNDQSFTLSSPYSSCNICHNTVLKDDFFVFPCGHVFHKNCYDTRNNSVNFDRQMMINSSNNSHIFNTNENQVLCPLCGLAAIELIDTPFYSLLKDDKEVDILAKDICSDGCYINELDNDFDD